MVNVMLTMLLVLFFGLLFLGVPIYGVILIAALLPFALWYPSLPLTSVAQHMVDGVRIFSLLAIPLFVLSGKIMGAGEISTRLVNFVMAMLGHIPGGLAHTSIGSMAVFGAISGSTPATIASIGTAVYPKLLSRGYRDTFCLGLIVNACNLAALIPPSILMILYGVNTKTSIGELFISGIGPGILVAIMFMLYCYFWAKRNNIPIEKRSTWLVRLKTLWDSKWAIGLIVVIAGGMFGGVFSPAETAAVAALYSIIVEMYIYKGLTWKKLLTLVFETGILSAQIFILLGASQYFSWVLTFSQVPQHALAAFMDNPYMNKWVFLLIVNICFFLACMIIDGGPAMLIMNPILFPIAMKYGIDPVHLGIIITMQTTIGSGTPPFGVNIFTACAVFKESYLRVIKEVWVFIGILVLAALIVTYCPNIALCLRDIVYR